MKKHLVFILLIVALIAVIINVIVIYSSSIQQNHRIQWIMHTYKVIESIHSVESLLKDVESGQRGYVIAQKKEFLEPYFRAKPKLDEQIAELKKLLVDNSNQLENLEERLIPKIQKRIEFANQVVDLMTRKEYSQARELVSLGIGKRLMDEVHETVILMIAEERQLLQKRNQTLDDFLFYTHLIRYLNMSFVIVIIIIAFINLRRTERENKNLVEQLQSANQNLTEKVAERTQELAQKNLHLNQTNEELEKTLEELHAFYDALQIKNYKTESVLQEIQDLYENAPCGYHSLDKDGIIIRMNKTHLDWLGFEVEEVINKMHVKEILTTEYAALFETNFAIFKQNGKSENIEMTLKRKDGSLLEISLNSTGVYDNDGDFIMTRSTIFDIRQRKVMELELQANNDELLQLNEELKSLNEELNQSIEQVNLYNNRLTEMNTEKTHFLGIASHDLKSPLNSIIGLVTIFQLDAENLNEEQQTYLTYIAKTSARMNELINNLLDINRIEAGNQVLELVEINLVDFIEDLVYGFQVIAKQKTINLRYHTDFQEFIFKTDRLLLRQILENLVSNALKFSLPQTYVYFKAFKKEDWVRFEIIDEGPGILVEEIPKLFQKFAKLSNQPTGNEVSTGLGLSIVKQYVELLNGKIWCESQIGKGSNFIIELLIA